MRTQNIVLRKNSDGEMAVCCVDCDHQFMSQPLTPAGGLHVDWQDVVIEIIGHYQYPCVDSGGYRV